MNENDKNKLLIFLLSFGLFWNIGMLYISIKFLLYQFIIASTLATPLCFYLLHREWTDLPTIKHVATNGKVKIYSITRKD